MPDNPFVASTMNTCGRSMLVRLAMAAGCRWASAPVNTFIQSGLQPRRSRRAGLQPWLPLFFLGMGFLWLAEPARSQVPPAPLLQIQLAGSQQLLLELSGATGRIYQVEISSNLLDWVPALTTNSVSSNVVATVGGPGGWASGFYRAVDLGPVSGGLAQCGVHAAVAGVVWGRLPSRKGSTPDGSVVFAVQNEAANRSPTRWSIFPPTRSSHH